jgi:hypothetical protein
MPVAKVRRYYFGLRRSGHEDEDEDANGTLSMVLRQNPDADLPRCYSDDQGENDRSLIPSDNQTRPLNQAPTVRPGLS